MSKEVKHLGEFVPKKLTPSEYAHKIIDEHPQIIQPDLTLFRFAQRFVQLEEENESLRDDVRKLSGEVEAMSKVVECARRICPAVRTLAPRVYHITDSEIYDLMDALDNLDKRDEGDAFDEARDAEIDERIRKAEAKVDMRQKDE